MSVIIKGMSKPTDCGLCPFEDFGYCAVKGERNTSEKGIDDDCPLVEIKDMTNEEFDSILARLMTDRKTENSSEKPNNCEHITEDGVTCAKYPACDDCPNNPLNKVKGSERLVKGSEKPNNCEYAENPSGDVWECGCFLDTYCEHQIYDRNPDGTINIVKCGYEPKDKPQQVTSKLASVENPTVSACESTMGQPKSKLKDKPQTVDWGKRKACTLELFDDDGNYIEPKTEPQTERSE